MILSGLPVEYTAGRGNWGHLPMSFARSGTVARCRASLFMLLTAVAAAGCTAHYPVNETVTDFKPEERYGLTHSVLGGRSDKMLVMLTFSGGGTRAAAFSLGVMEELARTRVKVEGEEVRLLDEVDAISSVSGGSFTAAYYGLFGDRLFEDFERDFLKVDVQGKLTRGLFSPFKWPKLWSPYYGRSEMAADLYDQLLFEGKTYRDMLMPGRPMVMINATDMALGAQFSFFQPQFTLLCSNLLDFPVSRAVTASSAVPIAFNSVILRNNTGECVYALPQFLTEAYESRDTKSRRFHQAHLKLAYLNREQRPFVHLQDGGLSDNLGVRAIMDAFFLRGGAAQALKETGLRQTNRIVIVVVNAESAKDLSSAKKDTSIPLFDTIGAAASVPLNHYSFETLELLHQQVDLWEKDLIAARCEYFLETKKLGAENLLETACTDVETYVIEVSFESIRDPEERNFFENLPTSFRLADDEVERLEEAGARLLRKSTEFQRFLRQLP